MKKFFFEKKNQKTLGPAGIGNRKPRPAASKSFLLLFFKKEALACLYATAASVSSA
jgi:hypothetical protein